MTPTRRFLLAFLLCHTVVAGPTAPRARAQDAEGSRALAAPVDVDATASSAYSVAADGQLVRSGPTPRRFDLGCAARAVHADAARLYVACGERRVIVLAIDSADPRVVGDIVLDADVTSFFVRGSETWVELANGSALALDRAPVRLAGTVVERTQAPNAASPVTPVAEARVSTVDGLEVTLDAGAESGFSIGSHVELLSDVATAAGEADHEQRRLAVGEIVAAAPHRARVRLGVGEVVPVGTRAQITTSRATASLVAPPRVGGLFELGGTVRPYVTLGALGAGFLVDAAVTYRARAPFYVRASLDPSGAVLLADATNGRQFQASLVGGVDHRYGSLGLGVAGLRYQTVTSTCTGTYYSTCQSQWNVTPRVGLVFDARIGARDGLHLASTTSVALVGREWKFASNDTTLQVPLGHGIWLLLRGGTGVEHIGYSYGTVAARFLASGNGGRGSLFLTGGIGWVGASYKRVEASTYYTTPYVSIDTVSGVALSLGAEYRM